MSGAFHEGQIAYQQRFDTRRLAETLASNASYGPEIHPAARRLIEAADMFFLATADSARPPGLLVQGWRSRLRPRARRPDDRFPSYDGNGIFASLGNIAVEPARSGSCSSTSSTGTGCG